jgi:hypothetical protein
LAAQLINTASNVRSRTPFRVVESEVEMKRSACSLVSQWPVRTPLCLGPFTREIAAARSGGLNPLSGAFVAGFRMAERR